MTAPSGRVVVGLVSLALGTVLLGGALGVWDGAGLLAAWWPTALVVVGLGQYVVDRTAGIGSLVLVVGGVVLLGFTTGVVEGPAWSFLLPAALILAGVGVMLPRLEGNPEVDDERVTLFVACAGRTVAVRSAGFTGGDATVLAGNLTLDLTAAQPVPGARLAVTVILGGCDVVVPPGWDVRIGGVPLLGGWDNTTRRDVAVADLPTLTVRAVPVLAGVEVRHPARWV